MLNFSIGVQVNKEIEDFQSGKVRLASLVNDDDTVRYLKGSPSGHYFNQADMISLIDLYDNSVFENGERDKLNQRKIFLNVGRFRREVASKQIDIDSRNFRFLPDDYADPWTAIFLQKEFKEYVKEPDSDLPEIINECVENFPKYGTVVLKQVGNDIKFVPLQNLRNEQTAKSLQTASYVIEEHPDMHLHEIKEMESRGWNSEGLDLKYGQTICVYERYGYVPLHWLKTVNGEKPNAGEESVFVPSKVICARQKGYEKSKNVKEGWHIFFAGKQIKRPYREAHWSRQHGRWLGVGVWEDLIPNQKAKNIIVNLVRRSLHWSAKRVFQSGSSEMAAKNLVKDVADGTILEVAANGAISEVPLSAKTNADFTTFLDEFERNADQKAFTYEITTGESLPSGTPFRLGVVLSKAAGTYFDGKREKLGLFFKEAITDFKIPKFLTAMSNEERVIGMFSDEPGFEVLKEAAMNYVRNEATRISLLSGQVVDGELLASAIEPFQAVKSLFFKLTPQQYKNAKYKFDFTVTGEELDLEAKLETLGNLYQLLVQKGDPRAEKVLERISALSGESLASFGPPAQAAPQTALPSNFAPSGAMTEDALGVA